MSPRNTRTPAAALVALVSLAACGQDLSTAPAPEPPLVISAADRAALGLLLDDALSRVIPSFQDQQAGARLRGAWTELARDLAAGGRLSFDRSLARTQALVGGDGSVNFESLESASVDLDSPLAATLRIALGEIAAIAHGTRKTDE